MTLGNPPTRAMINRRYRVATQDYVLKLVSPTHAMMWRVMDLTDRNVAVSEEMLKLLQIELPSE